MKRIPDISTAKLLRLASKIKFGAFVKGEAKRISLPITEWNLRQIAFTWNAEYGEFLRCHPTRNVVLITYHNFGAPSLFKPSISEVLAQIPGELVSRVEAFAIETENMGVYNVLPDGYHFTKTHLFLKK